MKSVGVLGGGQLARMMAIQAEQLGIKIFILSPSSQDPAAQVKSAHWVKGDPYSSQSLLSFLKLVDVLTFESEFIPASQIKKAFQIIKQQSLVKPSVKKSSTKKLAVKKPVHIAPNLKSLSLIQDRYYQKKLITKYNLETSPFVEVNLPNTNLVTESQLLSVFKKLGPFVLKTRTGGYDGYGTFIFKNKKDCTCANLAGASSQHFIAEQFIKFKKEMSLIAARNKNGEIVFFPLVETKQENSRCLWVKGPCAHKKLANLKTKIKKMLTDLKYEGLLAFELFDTGSQLLINELAPRVHNSGHYSLNGSSEDQFSLHLKSICNLALKTPKTSKGFAMLNVLGKSQSLSKPLSKSKPQSQSPSQSKSLSQSKTKEKNQNLSKSQACSQALKEKALIEKKIKEKLNKEKDIYFYWYGKTLSRQGRKMGHINSLASSPSAALTKLLKLKI